MENITENRNGNGIECNDIVDMLDTCGASFSSIQQKWFQNILNTISDFDFEYYTYGWCIGHSNIVIVCVSVHGCLICPFVCVCGAVGGQEVSARTSTWAKKKKSGSILTWTEASKGTHDVIPSECVCGCVCAFC